MYWRCLVLLVWWYSGCFSGCLRYGGVVWWCGDRFVLGYYFGDSFVYGALWCCCVRLLVFVV